MPTRLRVATRKGLFTFTEKDDDWVISETAFLGDPVTNLLYDDRDDSLYAALNLGHFGVKFHRRKGESGEWVELQAPTYPVMKDQPVSTELIWCLEKADQTKPGTLWAGTIPGGLFYSEDGGTSWHLNDSLWSRPEREQWFGGGYDKAGIHSILVDPRNNRHILVGVSCGGVWLSEDGGATWSLEGHGLRAEYLPPDHSNPRINQDPHRLARCRTDPDIVWMQHHNGIFLSEDRGRTWREMVDVSPSSFGFAVAVNPNNSNQAWFVPAKKDAQRVPSDGRVVVTRTDDGGQNFSQLTDGLPAEHAYDLIYRHGLDVDSSGQVLAFGSTTGNLWLSKDSGNTWKHVQGHLPPIYALRFD